MSTEATAAPKEVISGGMRFFYETRSFRTEKRSKSVLSRCQAALGEAPASVWRFFDVDEDRWIVAMLSEHRDVFETGLHALGDNGEQDDRSQGFMEILAARRVDYLNNGPLADVDVMMIVAD